VRRGDRVLVFAEKRIETVVALLATSAAGAVFVPVNPAFRARQIAQVARDCRPVAVVTTGDRYDLVADGIEGVDSVENVVLVDDSSEIGPPVGPWKLSAWADLPAAGPVPDGVAIVDDDVAAILYTSGSTGRPKGVVLTHRNLLAGAASVASYLQHTADDVVLAMLPLSFDAGLSQLTTTFAVGAHVVLENYLLPRTVVRLCARHRVTALTGVPPLWLQLAAQDWPEEATRHLRYFANTGGRMPVVTLTTLRRTFPHARPYLMYGLTEAFRSTYLDPAEVDRRPDSIGRAIPNNEVLVLRPDGSPCDPGEHGELVHRGSLVSLGYWNDPARTAERFRPLPPTPGRTRPEIGVWSGDTVYRDEEGFLYFVGRTDEMIKTSGYRVSPTEVEEAVYATGLVTEAVALGVPDPALGHRIVLVVAGDPTTVTHDRLCAALADDVPRYMLPHRTIVRPELPRSPNGKFDRVELRQAVGP
jgi:acyl-CoA ligase (AMP-forming) (exosortase A-associated)